MLAQARTKTERKVIGGFSFKRLFDYATIQSVLLNPMVYSATSDDFAPAREKFRARMDDEVWYVGGWHDQIKKTEFIGLWAFLPLSPIRWVAHTCLLPEARGLATQASRAMISWMWDNAYYRLSDGSKIPVERIITDVPVSNRLALRLAKECGMEVIGTDRQSIRKGGKLQDQILLGLSKP